MACTTTTFVYDGNGQRGKKTVGGTTTLYVNRYYGKTGDTVTTSYYLGGRLAAQRESTTLRYIHQDHLTGTSVTTASDGTSLGSIRYLPFGSTRSGSVPTDKKFTGQRLDGTGLYYYGARYYDPVIGRFISPDSIVQSASNPQMFNRYSYVLNNPLKHVDSSGHVVDVPPWEPPPPPVPPPPPEMPEFPLALTEPPPVAPNLSQYTVVWGYEGEGGFGFKWVAGTLVVKDTEGNFYRIETKGGGLTLLSVALSVVKQGEMLSTSDIGSLATWKAGATLTLIGLIDFNPHVSLGVSGNGPFFKADSGAYLAFSAPEPSLLFTVTSVEKIDPSEVFWGMPVWVERAYRGNKYR